MDRMRYPLPPRPSFTASQEDRSGADDERNNVDKEDDANKQDLTTTQDDGSKQAAVTQQAIGNEQDADGKRDAEGKRDTDGRLDVDDKQDATTQQDIANEQDAGDKQGAVEQSPAEPGPVSTRKSIARFRKNLPLPAIATVQALAKAIRIVNDATLKNPKMHEVLMAMTNDLSPMNFSGIRNLNGEEKNIALSFAKTMKSTLDHVLRTQDSNWSTDVETNQRMVKENEWLWIKSSYPLRHKDDPINGYHESTRLGPQEDKPRLAKIRAAPEGEGRFYVSWSYTFGGKPLGRAVDWADEKCYRPMRSVGELPENRIGGSWSEILVMGEAKKSGWIDIRSDRVPYQQPMAPAKVTSRPLDAILLDLWEGEARKRKEAADADAAQRHGFLWKDLDVIGEHVYRTYDRPEAEAVEEEHAEEYRRRAAERDWRDDAERGREADLVALDEARAEGRLALHKRKAEEPADGEEPTDKKLRQEGEG